MLALLVVERLLLFFARFGFFGVVMAMASVVLFSIVVYMELSAVFYGRLSASGCVSLANVNCGKALDGCQQNTKKTDVFFDWVIFICNFIVMSAMIAGVFDLVAVLWGGNVLISSMVLAGCFLCIIFGVKSLEGVNKFFIPTIVFWIVIIFLICIFGNSVSLRPVMVFGLGIKDVILAILMMLMYVGMNLLTILPIVWIVGGQIGDKKEIALIALVFGVGVAVILVMCVIMLVLFGDFGASMPTLMLARKSSAFIGMVYSLLIMFGLITTLSSTGFIVKQIINMKIKDNFISTLLCFVMGFVLSACGFKQIIDYLYPLIGVFGVGYMIRFFFQKTAKSVCKSKKKH